LFSEGGECEDLGRHFNVDHEQLIGLLNQEQRSRVEKIMVSKVGIPISAITLVIITSNNGKLLNR
jgi:hypothetical protein